MTASHILFRSGTSIYSGDLPSCKAEAKRNAVSGHGRNEYLIMAADNGKIVARTVFDRDVDDRMKWAAPNPEQSR